MYYVVNFVRKDDMPNEDFWYAMRENAEEHFNLFKDDDSDLYNRVELWSYPPMSLIEVHKFAD